MAGVISKITRWVQDVRNFFLMFLNRLQSMVLRNQKSNDAAIKLFWMEDRRIKICEEIFAVDLEILNYIQRSHPKSFDEKLQKFVQEKENLIGSWRNPKLPEKLEDLSTDPERRRQLCVQRAERCKQLYDSLIGFKKLYKEAIKEVGDVVTYDQKLHFAKPFSLFDPTCICCFLELKFHLPQLQTSYECDDEMAEENNENAPLLATDQPVTTKEPSEYEQLGSPRSQCSVTSHDTFISSNVALDSETSDVDVFHTIPSGTMSVSTLDHENGLVGSDSSDETCNAEDASKHSASSLSSAIEGSPGLNSSSEEAVKDSDSEDQYISDTKENASLEDDTSVKSSNVMTIFRD